MATVPAVPVTRQLKIVGRVMSTPAAATVMINGIEVYSGQIGIGQSIDQDIDLHIANYDGIQNDIETITVSIAITSGVAKLGRFLVDQAAPQKYGEWAVDSTNDGRTNILVNGLPPEWPATPVDPMPGGSEENPDWTGWCFEVSAGETLTCEYIAMAQIQP